jgi:hypothetical protein
MIIPKQITPIIPTPLEPLKRNQPKGDDRSSLYVYPFVWFGVLLAIAVLVWAFQLFVVPFFSHG